MNLKKKVQVIMLPTKHSNLSLYENKLSLAKANHNGIPDKMIPQHLFIVDDSEIKEGDYYIHFNTNTKNYILFKADSKFNNGNNPNIIDKRKFVYEYWNKKVIATTNSSLKITIEYRPEAFQHISLPSPSEQFVQKYVESYNKGNVITDVMIEWEKYAMGTGFNIKGDIPTEQEMLRGCYNDGKQILGEWEDVYKLKLKVDSKNEITIIRCKDSYSKEELKQLFDSYGDNIPAKIIWKDIQNL